MTCHPRSSCLHPFETVCCRSDLAGECRRAPIPDIGQFLRWPSAVPRNLTFAGSEHRRVSDAATGPGHRLLPLAATGRCRPKADLQVAQFKAVKPSLPRVLNDGNDSPFRPDALLRTFRSSNARAANVFAISASVSRLPVSTLRYSATKPEDLTIGIQRAASAAMIAANSFGVVPVGSSPSSNRRDVTSAERSASPAAAETRSTKVRGVLAGANSPNQCAPRSLAAPARGLSALRAVATSVSFPRLRGCAACRRGAIRSGSISHRCRPAAARQSRWPTSCRSRNREHASSARRRRGPSTDRETAAGRPPRSCRRPRALGPRRPLEVGGEVACRVVSGHREGELELRHLSDGDKIGRRVVAGLAKHHRRKNGNDHRGDIMTEPSAGAVFNAWAAMRPLAPGRFSTITLRPSEVFICAAIRRARMSVLPPAPKPTSSLSGAAPVSTGAADFARAPSD